MATLNREKIKQDLLEVINPLGGMYDWMFDTPSKNNPYTFHHIKKDCDGGKYEFENGALLTVASHSFLNTLEYQLPQHYAAINHLFKELHKFVRHDPTSTITSIEDYKKQFEAAYSRAIAAANKKGLYRGYKRNHHTSPEVEELKRIFMPTDAMYNVDFLGIRNTRTNELHYYYIKGGKPSRSLEAKVNNGALLTDRSIALLNRYKKLAPHFYKKLLGAFAFLNSTKMPPDEEYLESIKVIINNAEEYIMQKELSDNLLKEYNRGDITQEEYIMKILQQDALEENSFKYESAEQVVVPKEKPKERKKERYKNNRRR